MEQYSKIVKEAGEIPLVDREQVSMRGKPTKYVMMVEQESNDALGMATDAYQLVQHRDIFNAVEQLQEYKINRAELYKYGSHLCIELMRKDAIPVQVLPKDGIIPMARILNSYNCTLSVAVCSFGIRKVCTNGMIAPVGTKWISRDIHIGDSVDISGLRDNIEKAIGLWDASKDVIKNATNIKMESEVALFYVGLPKKYSDIAIINLKREDSLYNIWNEVTRILSHEADVSKGGEINYQKKANSIFDLSSMTQEQVNRLHLELKAYNERHNIQ